MPTDKLALKPVTCYESRHDYTLALIANGHLKLSDNLILGRIDVQQQFGSIILPESSQVEQNTATIIQIAANLDKATFPIGAHFIPVQHAGKELSSKGSDRLVVYDTLTEVHAVFLED